LWDIDLEYEKIFSKVLTREKSICIIRSIEREKEMTKHNNNLSKIFAAMIAGKYIGVIDPKGNAHCGLVNGIMREDGSGKNWILTITNRCVNEKVFIHAS
jgi:hypothetical protein